MSVTDKIKLPKEILALVEKTNEPMSLDEIVEKFNPPFPFQVRKVANGFEGYIFTIVGCYIRKKGMEIKHFDCPVEWYEVADGRVYISKECTHCLGLNDSCFDWRPGTKSWVLI